MSLTSTHSVVVLIILVVRSFPCDTFILIHKLSAVPRQHYDQESQMCPSSNILPHWERPIRILKGLIGLAVFVLSAALLATCSAKGPTESSGPTEPSGPSTIAGIWLGASEFLTPSGNESWRLSLTEFADDSVSGSYQMTSPEWGSISGDVIGSYSHPSVSLSLSVQFSPSSNAISCWYSGTMETLRRNISGRLSCPLRIPGQPTIEVSGPLDLRKN